MQIVPGPHGGRPNRARRAVFISSTSIDLAEYRRVVIDTLLRMGLHPLAMEHMGSQPKGDATSVSYDYLAQADLYLGIVAWRYGYVPAGETRSVTHLEYEEAKRRAEQLSLPRLMFLADPSTEQDEDQFPQALRVAENQGKLRDFRTEVGKENVVAFFTTPEDLGRKVATAFSRYARPLAPANLPGRTDGFVGRQEELQEVTALLLGQETGGEKNEMPSAVALIGMAGVGKSTLAAEVVHTLATERADRYPGGFTWVRCDSLTDLAGVAPIEDHLLADWEAIPAREDVERAATVEEGIALREQALRKRLQPLTGQEAPEAALVFLDNIEPGLPLGRLLQTLHPLGLQVLLTSRAEPFAGGVRLKRVDVVDPAAARSLFVERYRAAGGSWDAANEATAAAEVVGALGWLPLAIELAAARAGRNQLRVAALATELLEPNVLAKLRDPLNREASVRYAFEQSVGTDERRGTLTWAQRQRFVALGLLDGTDWPRAVVERYLDARLDALAWGPSQAGEVRSGAEDLEALVALSLVSLVATGAAGAESDGAGMARVRLHPLLREYARELAGRLRSEQRAAALEALLEALTPFVAEHKQDFPALSQEEELIAGALSAAAREHTAPEALVAAVGILTDYLVVGGHWQLGMELMAAQRAAYQTLSDRAGEGVALGILGILADNQGRAAEAAGYFEQALAIAREVGDRAGEGVTLVNLGELARTHGHAAEAADYYEQALAIAREVGDRAGEGTVLHNLGALADTQGRPAEAADYYEQALVIAREVGDRAGEGVTLGNLGTLADTQGRPAEAASYYEQALAIAREVGNRAGEGAALHSLGNLASDQGRLAEAASYYEQALAIAREVGDRAGEGTVLHNLGALADTQGRAAEAAGYYEQALAIAREVGDRAGEGTVLHNLGLVSAELKRTDQARGYFVQARTTFEEIGALDDAQDAREQIARLASRGWWPFGRRGN